MNVQAGNQSSDSEEEV